MVDKPIFEFINRPAFKSGAVGIPINAKLPSLGHYWAIGPEYPPGQEESANQYCNLDFTGPPGTASIIYFSLLAQYAKWGFNLEKADEWIEVHPTHREYYERTMATKQMLEGVIKTGLKSAAESIADYELIKHDVRKYKEILRYFASENEHLLRSMFIDQVDIHTGEGISLRSIVPRWPTIISDFMRLSSEEKKDIMPDEIKDKYEVSKAEAVILKTKNDLYKEWKTMFGEAAKERYSRLVGLMTAREKTIDEYRDWIKPYIARFKMTKLGAESPLTRREMVGGEAGLLGVTGLATYKNVIRLWAWKPLLSAEPRKPGAEMRGGWLVYPYDDYIRENLILDRKRGLANIYSYLADDKKKCINCRTYYSNALSRCPKCSSIDYETKKYADEIVENELLPLWARRDKGLDPAELYYVFQDFTIKRVGFKLPVGEVDDVVFYMKNMSISQNTLLVKLLELRCREMELEKYINQILGITGKGEESIQEIVEKEFPTLFKKEKPKEDTFAERLKRDWQKITAPYENLKFKPSKKPIFTFTKPGQYERDFVERITKQYLIPADILHSQTVNFIKSKMGMP